MNTNKGLSKTKTEEKKIHIWSLNKLKKIEYYKMLSLQKR